MPSKKKTVKKKVVKTVPIDEVRMLRMKSQAEFRDETTRKIVREVLVEEGLINE